MRDVDRLDSVGASTGADAPPGAVAPAPAAVADGTPAHNETSVAGIVGAIIAVSVWGVSSVIAKVISMGGIALSSYRFLTFGIVWTLVLRLRGSIVNARVLRLSFWGGLALAADVAFFFSAVKVTTIANATVIGALQPILLAAVGARLFGERMRGREMLLGVVAIVGAAVVVFAASGSPEWSLGGDMLAVGALFSWAAYFVISKQMTDEITTTQYTVGVALWVGVLNAPLALLFGQSMAWPDAEDWFWLLVMAFGSGVLGHQFMNWSIQRIPLWLGSMMTIFIPVVSTAAAWLFLDEAVTALQVGAMVVVLAALAAIVVSQTSGGSVGEVRE